MKLLDLDLRLDLDVIVKETVDCIQPKDKLGIIQFIWQLHNCNHQLI